MNSNQFEFKDQITVLNQMIGLIGTIQNVQKDVVKKQLTELNERVTSDCGVLFREQEKIGFLQNIIESVEQQYGQRERLA